MKESKSFPHQKWIVVLSIGVIGFVIGGASAGVIGSVLSPLMKEFHWSNSLTSSVATGYSLGVLLTTPAIGVALDRLGARAVMTFGAITISIGLCLASRSHSWFAMLAAFSLVGIGVSASFYLPSAVVVTNWMSTQRSLGMGIVMGAMSAGAALFSPLIGWWIETYGWRLTLGGIAALIALMLPLILLIVRTHPPDRAQTDNSGLKSPMLSTARRDLSSAAFALSTTAGVLFSVGMQGVYFHVVPLLVNAGYSAHVAGLAFGATWLLSGVGSLVLGIVGDHFDTKRVLAGALLCCSLGTVFLFGAAEKSIGLACVVAFVLLWGTATNSFGQLAPVLLAERFGFSHLGTLIGVQFAIAGTAGAAAPVITGLLYDKLGDYRLAVGFSALANLVGCILIVLIKIPKCGADEDGNSRRWGSCRARAAR